MNNELMAMKDIVDIANAFWASGMFIDVKSAAQAIVKIQAGQELGIPPFTAMTGIHIIQGKPTVGAGIMASRIKSSIKYDYKVVKKTNEICQLEFFEDDVSQGIEEFTIEDAKRAGTQNIAKYPKNMLFARCVSNGLKTYSPDVFIGPVYAPEEFGVATEDTAADVSDNTDKNKARDTTTLLPDAPLPTAPNKMLLFDSEEYNKAIDFLKTGGTIDKLRVRYDIGPQQADEMTARARQTTQEDIHNNNANYVAPTPTAAAAPTQDTDLSAEPF